MARLPSIGRVLLDGLGDLYREELFTDVQVEVESRKFQCHRLVLSAVSPVLRAMFVSGMSESLSGHVTLHDITAQAFEAILRVVYLGERVQKVLTAENVQDVHFAACYLGLESLAKKAEDFITKRLSPDNALPVWRLAKRLSRETMADNAFHYVLDNFVTFRNEGQVLSLTLEELCDIISSDRLSVPDEEAVVEGILGWVETDRENNAPHLPRLLSHLRPCFLQVDTFSDLLQNQGLFTYAADLPPVLHDALDLFPEQASGWQLPGQSSRPRQGFRVEVGVALYGKRLFQEPRSSSLAEFSFSKQKSFLPPHCPLWKDLGDRLAFCGSARRLFLCGGTKVFQCRNLTRQWSRLPELPVDFHDHALLGHGHSLYVVGGWSVSERTHDAYTLDVSGSDGEADWRPFGWLKRPVSSFGAAVVGDSIFIVGGHPVEDGTEDEDGEEEDQGPRSRRSAEEWTSDVQRLDLTTGECEVVNTLIHPWGGGQVSRLPDGKLYVFHGSGLVERLCPVTFDHEEVCRLSGIVNAEFAVAPHEETLFVFGQPDGCEDVALGGLKKVRYLYQSAQAEGCVKTLLLKDHTDCVQV